MVSITGGESRISKTFKRKIDILFLIYGFGATRNQICIDFGKRLTSFMGEGIAKEIRYYEDIFVEKY